MVTNDSLLEIGHQGENQFERLCEEDDCGGVVAVAGAAVARGGHQQTLGHEHGHVEEEHHQAGPGREQGGQGLAGHQRHREQHGITRGGVDKVSSG